MFASLPIVATDPRPVLMVIPGNLGGSVEHVHHLMPGYLLPFMEPCQGMRGSHRFLVRDCGPMNPVLGALTGFQFNVRPVHKVLEVMVGMVPGSTAMPRIMIPGFDAPHVYSPERFRRIPSRRRTAWCW